MDKDINEYCDIVKKRSSDAQDKWDQPYQVLEYIIK